MSEDKNVNKKGFWKGMKSELKKVIWPTGEQTVKSTFATIAFVFMVSIVLIVFNYAFNGLSKLWINSLSHEDVITNPLVSSGDSSASGEENTVSEDENSSAGTSGEVEMTNESEPTVEDIEETESVENTETNEETETTENVQETENVEEGATE